MATARTLQEWPHLELDPVEAVALAKLCVFLTGDDYGAVFKSFVDQTPPQPDVQPWDFENLIPPVLLIPERYVRGLAAMEDKQIPKLAKQWCAIPELSLYEFGPQDVQFYLLSCRELAANCLKSEKSMLFLLAP